ncbi:MAG: hypothetical protein LBE79_06750 [Tannerella sp.]|jgi:hypothetical protein|nr:hypothetical protein [Tannerella sp.]
MYDNSKHHKEVIKNRMYRNATAILGARDIDSLDPVVKLKIDLLAGEINKLAGELENKKNRLFERLSGILTPDILLSVRPAHMILHAKPLEEQDIVYKSTVFHHKRKDTNIIHFSPACDFNLIDGDVHSLICAGKLYRMDNRKSKEIHEKSKRRSGKFTDTLWIGLNINPSITKIENLTFYFDLPNIKKRNELLHLLPYSRWEQEGTQLSAFRGIHSESEAGNKTCFPLHDNNPANVPDQSILEHYKHRYITIGSEIVNHKNNYRILPGELSGLFPNTEHDEMLIPLLWLKVTLPPGFDDSVLDDFFVSVNAFPVVNRKFYSKQGTTDPVVSVFRFETGENEHFLSVDRVFDSKRCKYIPFSHHTDEKYSECGSYILKLSGSERYDSRNAKETLACLTDLLREEKPSFSIFEKGLVEEQAKRIAAERILMELRLEDISSNRDRDTCSWMVIDSKEAGETLYVDYWVTNCESANGIKPGTLVYQYGNSRLAYNSLITLTQSYGGKQRRDTAPDMYKYMLTSRDMIYTHADIVNFCHARFGDRITLATITGGVRVSPRPKEGLIRSIDVHITLNETAGKDSSSHQDMEDRLLSSLKKRSPAVYNYRIFISNPNQG